MKLADCNPFDEVFSWEDPDTKVLKHFNATMMGRYAVEHRFPVVEFEMTQEVVNFIKKFRGTEQWKLDRLKEPYLSLPVIMLDCDDGTQLCVDGHHRILRRWAAGVKLVDAYVFPNGEWSQFVIEDLPTCLR